MTDQTWRMSRLIRVGFARHTVILLILSCFGSNVDSFLRLPVDLLTNKQSVFVNRLSFISLFFFSKRHNPNVGLQLGVTDRSQFVNDISYNICEQHQNLCLSNTEKEFQTYYWSPITSN